MINLAAVYSGFQRRAQHFLLVASNAATQNGKARDQAAAHIVVELQTALGFVARAAFLAGAVGGWTARGTRLRGRFPKSVDALLAAASVVRKNPQAIPGRDEPAWHSGDHMARVATSVLPANYGAFLQASSAYPSVLSTMTASRNFYAHRNEHTRMEAETALRVKFGVVPQRHMSGTLLAPRPGGAPLLETWVWNYLDVVELLCDR